MNYIDDLNKMNNIRLSSKRNLVLLHRNEDNNAITKKFSEKEFFDRELKIYYLLEKEGIKDLFRYPRIIEYNDEELLIKFQYIDGETLLSNFERYEQNNDIESGIKLMNLLFQWIQFFQTSLTKTEYIDELSSVGIILNSKNIKNEDKAVSFVDINFKNFIQKDTKLYGLDFENVNIEKKITDYTKSLAYMMTYNPIGSKYKNDIFNNILNYLNDTFNFSIESIYKSYNEELKKIERRRNISIEDLYIT